MNIHDLRQAQVRFENKLEEIKDKRKELHKLRSSFVKHFNYKRLKTMEIDDYVAGWGKPEKGYNFCYTIEWDLDGLGKFVGATAYKFGVYWSKENDEYRFTEKFGKTYKVAFESVREAILELLSAAEKDDINTIVNNKLSLMFKGKILSTYFPEKYLNIFSENHLNFLLKQLDLDNKEIMNSDAVIKREALIEFKNQDPIMVKWTVDLYAHFLLKEYPGGPPRDKIEFDKSDDQLSDYRTPNFAANPSAEFIDLNIYPPNPANSTGLMSKEKRSRKPDYEKESRKMKLLGDRGEKIVMDLEIKRLNDAGKKHLAKKVKRVSLISDSYGYDILSFQEDGTERYVEVKATSAKVGSANFFYTANELKTAFEVKNYFIYMVYDVVSASPKVWVIKNPFKPVNNSIVMKPITYKITINTKKTTKHNK